MNESRPEMIAADKVIDALFDLDEETRARVLDLVETFFRPTLKQRGRPFGSKNRPKAMEGAGA